MASIWKGSISFGLVNIPVSLHPATKREELSFRLLRSSDLSPVNYKRVAEVDGKEVPWEQIVKGYEYEKGKFVVLKEEDFKRVDIEATQTIDIMDFVDLSEVNPIFFSKPYFLEPQKGGSGAYALLREVLAKTNRGGIAKVVIRTRQHLAAVKANGDALVLELMHFAEELVDQNKLKIDAGKKPAARELQMATTLVENMTQEWDPARYTDEYASALLKLIEKKIESGGKDLPAAHAAPKRSGKVIDLVAVLQESLNQSGQARSGGSAKKAAKKPSRKKAA
ncbi:MAG TPA: Ku protein [Opitutaceae bacterium]|nr:Ku protein [Opitutaceae bacterium]